MNRKLLIFIKLSVIAVLALSVTSCATTKRVPKPKGVEIKIYESPGVPGPYPREVYHTVAPGETLWRIAQMYGVDIGTIKKANRISDVKDVDIGKKLYIPGASARKNVVTLYPNTKWRYIVVHHSATDMGNSQQFYFAHKKRGWETVGYHFIIDNGSCGKDPGQIETSPRWIKQMDGAHCKAGNMNSRGIGICLVGNFSQDKVSPQQMSALVLLVNELRSFYKIPKSNIIGHGSVPGAQTECPGKRFPWNEFWSRLGR